MPGPEEDVGGYDEQVEDNMKEDEMGIMNDEEFEVLVTDDRSIFVLTGNYECEE